MVTIEEAAERKALRNPPAFPNDVKPITERAGMTLRDYFAAKAMPIVAGEIYTMGRLDGVTVPDLTAKMSYEFADAMLKAREA